MKRWLRMLSLSSLCLIAPSCGVCEDAAPVKASAELTLGLSAFAALTPEGLERWSRHVQTSLAWEVRDERGCFVAYRVEPRQADEGTAYETSLNAYYQQGEAEARMETRVSMTLGCPPGRPGRVLMTRAKAAEASVRLLMAAAADGRWSSSLIVSGGAETSLWISERSASSGRAFTQEALGDVEAELKAVLTAAGDTVEALMPEGSVRRAEASLEVRDGIQPGIYRVEGWVNPQADGVAELRVFFVGPAQERESAPAEVGAPGDELSSKRLRPRSRRRIGWSADPKALFNYQSIVSVYEGDWGHPYTARFELWFHSADEKPQKLVETTREIEGWMR